MLRTALKLLLALALTLQGSAGAIANDAANSVATHHCHHAGAQRTHCDMPCCPDCCSDDCASVCLVAAPVFLLAPPLATTHLAAAAFATAYLPAAVAARRLIPPLPPPIA